jgi:hypothetical protein
VYKVLSAESCSGGDSQTAAVSVAANQNPHQKTSLLFRESFISSGKQGSGAAVLGEEHDVVTRET